MPFEMKWVIDRSNEAKMRQKSSANLREEIRDMEKELEEVKIS